MKKRILASLLIVCMLLAVLPVTAAADGVTELSGSGTAAEPYLIGSVDELKLFRDKVNGGNTYAGEYIKLTADIDLTGETWIPIGTSNYDKTPTTSGVKMFAGNFDGGNHTITGLSSDGYDPASTETGSTEYSFGLFGYVYGANISNVKLANVDIDCGTRTDSANNTVYGSGIAALIGYYVPKDEATSVIENCHVLSGTISATNNMGGLIGHMDSQISQPSVDITIKDCSNAADVTTEAREAGGILGLMNSAREGNSLVTMRGTVTFKNCVNTGNITSLGGGAPSAGGILGRDHNQAAGQRLKIVFDGCKNSGTITVTANGETHAAGIGAGYYSAGAWLIAKDCENTGNVVVNNPSSKVYAGGLISYGGVVELINSTSTGTVAGGIGNIYVGGAQNILFLEKMDGYNDTVNGNTYYLNGGTSPEYAALVDDAAGGGNFHLVETAYKDGFEFAGWYDNAELGGEAYTELDNSVKTYYAKWNECVAKIGKTYYTTLQAAIDAAEDGDTITILADVAYTGSDRAVIEGKTLTIDLGGHTVTGEYVVFNIRNGADVTLKNGTVRDTKSDACAIQVFGAKATLAEDLDVISDIGAAVAVYGKDGYETVLTTYADLTTNDSECDAAISGQGTYDGTVINVAGGTLNSATGVAIYHPQNGTLNITGGTINANTGIIMKSGTLNITGGTINATGDKVQYEYVPSGYSLTGDAVVIENVGSDTGYEAIASVSITGGTFTSANASAVASYAATSANTDAVAVTNFITGGVFSTDVTDYCAEGYTAAPYKEGVYGIVPKPENDAAVTYVTVTFETDPTGATIFVTGVDKDGYTPVVITDDNNSFGLVKGYDYNYTVSATGYESESKTFTATEEKTIEVRLKPEDVPERPPVGDVIIPGIILTDDTTATMMPEKDVLSFGDALGLYQMLLLQSGSFADVAKTDWFYSDVTALVNKGVVSGYPDGSFRPQGEVTWGEALKLVMKAVGYGDIEATNGHWASGYMDMAVEKGLISGSVELDAAITRGEIADLTALALKLGEAKNAVPFADEAPASAAALYEAGIINGSLDNGQLLYRAESTITRAEMAAIIWRVYCAR